MAKAKPRGARERGGFGAGDVYRLCRMLHAYLSAFAFLALIFFSVTGLTLNHPDWLAGARPRETTTTLRLSPAEVARSMTAQVPARALAEAVGRRTRLLGGFASGEVADGQALIRLEGPRGTSDVTVTLATGETEAAVRPASLVGFLGDLHKAKAVGPAWSVLVDACAVLFLALALIGYALFFSLRFRLVPSLVLTALSLVGLAAMALLVVR
jgi:hypothetical protein